MHESIGLLSTKIAFVFCEKNSESTIVYSYYGIPPCFGFRGDIFQPKYNIYGILGKYLGRSSSQ